MSRYNCTIELPHVDLEYVMKKETAYMLNEGFKSVRYKGSGMYYKKTNGWFDGPQYIKFSFKTVQKSGVKMDEMMIEAFIKFPLLPFLPVGEMGITGSFCDGMKTGLVRSINDLISHTQKVVKEFLKDNSGPQDYPNVYCTIG